MRRDIGVFGAENGAAGTGWFIIARMSGLRGRPPGGPTGSLAPAAPIPHPQVAQTDLALVLPRSVDIAVQRMMPSRREAANFWGQFLRHAQVLCVVKHDSPAPTRR